MASPRRRRLQNRLRSRGLLVRRIRAGRAQALRLHARRTGATTLILANAYARPGSVPEISRFLANVELLGEGRIRILLVSGWTSSHDRDEERTVIRDLASGVADLAWVGARSVGAVLGVRSLDALHAPLLFRDEGTVRRCLAAAPTGQLLTPLQKAGMVGLLLLPGGVRRPFGITAPLVGPADWEGKVIRIHASLTGEATIRALRATPVLRSAAELAGGPPAGVDGMDLHAQAITTWGYSGWLTRNVLLWPRILLVAANRRRLERLSASERAVLEEAARLATPLPGLRPAADEAEGLPQSVRLVEATEHDLELLRERFRPVYDELRSSEEAEPTLAYVERFVAAAEQRLLPGH